MAHKRSVCWLRCSSKGEEEKEIIDICQHIGPSSNDVSSRQMHENDFKSSMLSLKRPKHGPQKGVFAEVFIKTESGEEEKEIIGIANTSDQAAMMFPLDNCMKMTLRASCSH
jgi:hypothetical protein